MRNEDADLLAAIALVHGIESANAVAEFFRAGDADGARALGRAALAANFLEEKARIEQSRGMSMRRRRSFFRER